MITVIVAINNVPIYTRTAVRVNKKKEGYVHSPDDIYSYKVSDGSVIKHRYGDGANKLAIKMLSTKKLIKKPKG